MPHVRARNPRAEATARLGEGRVSAVLEPSRPAVNTGPWFADDPVAAGATAGDLVTPIKGSSRSWDSVVDAQPELAGFARDHWLANLKRIGAPPGSLAPTREALRSLAFYVLSPARQTANGKIGLRWTKGGFGTPFFGDDRQIRVQGDLLVVQDGEDVVSEPITTLRAAGKLVGVEPGAPSGIDFHDPPPEPDHNAALPVDPAAVAFLDDWFGFATLVLERLRAAAGRPEDTRVQLWPEHFDAAIEIGNADRGTRAGYGASPGDDAIDQPYLYVSPWTAQHGDHWNAPFGGAALTLGELIAAPDQAGAAAAFFGQCRDLLG
ncbi:MAG: hypothetical protein JJLCMIEE_03631 [Acidimicrobiales bacterium]|nr:MAG: hypothetical protein EDR02_11795 [Actinomycetota bacterium]MBV6510475.1 hypothetical protein [Acidimicrobiales bacterium]